MGFFFVMKQDKIILHVTYTYLLNFVFDIGFLRYISKQNVYLPVFFIFISQSGISSISIYMDI